MAPMMGKSGGEGLVRSCGRGDWVRGREPIGGVELLRAWFGGRAYARHRHDTYAIGVTEAGVQMFDYRGRVERAEQSQTTDESLPGIVLSKHGLGRVAVVATGGLSHEPGGPRYFWVDEAFDRWFLDLLKRGDHAALLRECTLERMEAAGPGGTAELLAWVLVLALTRGPADVLAYMPAVAWRSGTGMVVWNEMA